MSDLKFLKKYFSDLKDLLNNEKYFEDLVKVKKFCKRLIPREKSNDFGNGGSAQ